VQNFQGFCTLAVHVKNNLRVGSVIERLPTKNATACLMKGNWQAAANVTTGVLRSVDLFAAFNGLIG
jgi:hypothetical protein